MMSNKEIKVLKRLVEKQEKLEKTKISLLRMLDELNCYTDQHGETAKTIRMKKYLMQVLESLTGEKWAEVKADLHPLFLYHLERLSRKTNKPISLLIDEAVGEYYTPIMLRELQQEQRKCFRSGKNETKKERAA
jgi:hypothetical protein